MSFECCGLSGHPAKVGSMLQTGHSSFHRETHGVREERLGEEENLVEEMLELVVAKELFYQL